MSKFLSIIIPRYKESEKDIFPLLSSINNQLTVDFSDIEVLICSDGGGPGELDRDFLKIFNNLEIRQINLEENRGPGIARQTGIDNARGQYLMFCDADDIIHNVGVIGALIQEAMKNVPDIIATTWLEEVVDLNGKYGYVTHKEDATWMHGKMLRKQFLVQNNIVHHPSLRVHEDSYILALAYSFTNRATYMDFVSYVWKFQPDSITRRNNAIYTYNSIPTFIFACCEAHKLIEKKNPELMEYRILQFSLYMYFSLHQPGWLSPEHKKYLDDAEETFSECMKPFWNYWTNASFEKRSEVYNQERNRNFNGLMENETVDEWVKRIGLES